MFYLEKREHIYQRQFVHLQQSNVLLLSTPFLSHCTESPPNGSLCVAGYRRLTGTVSKQCLFSFLFFSFRKQKKGGEAFDESMLELVSRMNAAFKTKAPQEIITVSSIPCQVPDDCPIFSFN